MGIFELEERNSATLMGTGDLLRRWSLPSLMHPRSPRGLWQGSIADGRQGVSGHQKTYFSDHRRYLLYGVVLGLEMRRSLNRK
jgi:hypothetical protein